LWTVNVNLSVCSPVLLPFPYSRPARRINRGLLQRSIAPWLASAGLRPLVLWTFLPTPIALDLMTLLPVTITVYYSVDDLPSSSPAASKLRSTEARMLAAADLVFVTSRKLRERALAHRGEAHLLPFGVDYARFQAVCSSPSPLPNELEGLARPLIGYVGGVHRWVDQALLEAVVDAMPDATFVFLGPLQTEVGRLASLPNVRFLGPRPHAELARYIKAFDVGIVPYRLTEYTAHVYPTKLNEYLAMGIPVVATDLAEIRHFNERHGPVVRVAADAASFVQHLRETRRGSSAAEVSRRVEIARENSWEARIAEMTTLVEGTLAAREAQGLG
jgi:glycosyltransferase involved in cell wall biosynthesis